MSPNTLALRPLTVRAAWASALLATAFGLVAPTEAAAETRLRARYSLTLSGFDIGTATLQTGVDRASYDVNMSVRMSGLVKFFTAGKGAATSRGALQDARVTPSAYALNTKASSKSQVVRFAMAGGAVRQLSIEPPPKPRDDLVEITEADKKNIVDPLSALVMPVPGTGDMLQASSCDRTLPIFDGRQRYDVTLRYDRTETAKPDTSGNADPKAKAGYDGKLIVCKASYKAIAGHKPGADKVTFMENNKEMEVWLAPIAGARTLFPWRISVRTQMGLAVITATSFVVETKGGAGKGVDL